MAALEAIKSNDVAAVAKKYNRSEQWVRDCVAKELKKGVPKRAKADLESASSGSIDTNAVPPPLIYSLADGANLIGITPEQLLHYGALGKIRLCIPVGEDCLTVSSATAEMINRDPIYPDPSMYFSILNLDRVNYLLVEVDDCQKLEIGGFPARGHFFGGYLILGNEHLWFKQPTVHRVEDMKKQQYFHLLTGYRPAINPRIDLSRVGVKQHIHKIMLMVAAEPLKPWPGCDPAHPWLVEDLQSLVKSEVDRKPSKSALAEEFMVHENRSSLLAGLDQAAFELWGDFNPIRSGAFNTPEKVADYLVANFKVPKIHAVRGARMIFPDGKANPIRSQERPYRSAMLQDLINMWGAVCSGRRFQKGRGEEALYAKAVEDWLNKARTGLVESVELRKSAAMIIMPDNAPFKRSGLKT